MPFSERLFAPPDADASKIEQRQAELPPELRQLIQSAGAALERGQLQSARPMLGKAALIAPFQPDILRLGGQLLAKLGQFDTAWSSFEQALLQAPHDALVYHNYAEACELAGDIERALQLRKRSIDENPESPLAWYDYGDHLFRHVGMASAIEALGRSVALDFGYAPATLRLGSALVYAGRIEEGAAAFRRTLQIDPSFGAAWYSLANIKTVQLIQSDIDRMSAVLGGVLDESDRIAIEFALAKACEDGGQYETAYKLLLSANARKRRHVDWRADQFSAQVEFAERLFAAPHASAPASEFGREVIFIVGLPRSGTTLTEQIIASHSCVEGANELGDLGRILGEESARRQRRYPEWIPDAGPEDWQRLGQRYLDSTARWRRHRSCFTDKMPTNWLFLGAIRAMLPGAHIVICRRDPLENCWSCFKQYFFAGWEFTFSVDDLAAYWRDFDRSTTAWSARAPDRIREQNYESLLGDPDQEIRKLLAFCDLPFEEACVNFHQSRRDVRTASAGQVRQPLQKDTSRAARYGALLNPLRTALGLPPFADSKVQ